MPYLADTNIVGRWVQPRDPQYPIARAAITALRNRGEILYITPQIITEFWATATRPVAANGLGLTAVQNTPRIRMLLRQFPLLPDTPVIYPLWENLVVTHGILGRQVYDARLVAVMQAHGVTHLLTFNVNHFQRFPGITVVDPAMV
jgi:predicted nucleic acid-binding protein